jgi:DNA-binding MarR family transcriptional regulator
MRADELRAFDKLFELAARLGELMAHTLAQRGLTSARAEALLVLHRRGPMVQRQLSQALRCTPRHVTALVDALEGQGLVARGRHPTDRRATLVTPTRRGAAAAARMDDERRQAAAALFGEVPAGELAAFVAVTDLVLDLLGQASPTPATR